MTTKERLKEVRDKIAAIPQSESALESLNLLEADVNALEDRAKAGEPRAASMDEMSTITAVDRYRKRHASDHRPAVEPVIPEETNYDLTFVRPGAK